MLNVSTSSLSKSLSIREDEYPYATIWINGRHVSIERICQDTETARSFFEQSVFAFIKEWLSGEQPFTITTSGSTGPPKLITITRSQMIASARRTAEKIGLPRHTRALVCIDPRFIGGKMMLARCLTLGLRIMVIDPVANPLTRIPVDKCVQFTAFVPYQIHSILESKHPHLLNDLDHVLIGGAPLGLTARDRLDQFQCRCYETYGMTETVSHIALRLTNTAAKQPYFETLPGVDISVDERGCLVIATDYLPGPVITNDLVELKGPGKFLWLGRWDSVINSGGVKIIPEKIEKELENIFQKNKFNHRFFIAALPDEKLTNKTVLIVEGVQFSSELLQRSLNALRSAVSVYELPKEVYSIPEFALTKSRKIDRIQTLPGITFHSTPK